MYIPGGIFYPFFQEPGTFVSSVSLSIIRDDGYYYDFSDSTFKDTGWTTKVVALAEKTEGIWVLAAGWTIPSGPTPNRHYRALYKDNAGTVYEGEQIAALLPLNFVSFALSGGGAVTVATNNDKTGYGLSSAAVQAIWDALTTGLTTVGSIGKRLVDYVTGDIYARLGAPVGVSVSADIAAVQADTDNLQTRIPAALVGGRIVANAEVVGDKTGYSVATGGIGAGAHAAAELNSMADATLDRNMATGTDSGTDTTAVRTPRQALRMLRNKTGIAAGVLTCRKEDDVTASFTAAVTTTAGNPVSEIDPS